jgi:RHS repeat-associated protein
MKRFIGKEHDSVSLLADHGVRKYDYDLGRFTCPDPLWEKYYSWTPYQYAGCNPVSMMDGNGENAVAIIGDNSITIKAVYVVNPATYSSSEISSMQTNVNKTLNEKNYTVSEGDYANFSVKFDLQFVNGENPDGTINNEDDFNVGGINIGNTLIKLSQDESYLLKSEEPGKASGGKSDGRNILINKSYDSLRILIHEIFHTLFFNNDDAPSGIGSYSKPDLPNQNDIDKTVNNPTLQKINGEEK